LRVFHLSHTDLDGYGAQLVTKNIFENIEFLNSNYGAEILIRIDHILNSLKKDEKNFILITDLNLNINEARYLDERVKELKNSGYDIKLQLLDHHASGVDSAKIFEWYYLDVTRSAAKITYDFFSNSYEIGSIKKLIDAINAVDIWLQDDHLFEFGKVLMRLLDEAKELNRYMFPKESTLYKHELLTLASKFLEKSKGHILLDDNIYLLKKEYFTIEKRDTLDNMVANYIVNLLSRKKDNLTIFYQEKKGILTFGIQNSSLIGNSFLKQNLDFYFFMNLNGNGSFSLRANNKIDVSKIAYNIAKGGGHPNASGGKIENFKDCFFYHQAKESIEELLKNS